MIKKIEHIGVKVKDMDASIAFYTNVLGLNLVAREKLDDGVELGFLSMPGTENVQIELIGRGHDELPNDAKIHHIAFTVSDIEAEIEKLRAHGVQLLDETPRIILDGVKIAFFFGPDGERLEFFQPNNA